MGHTTHMRNLTPIPGVTMMLLAVYCTCFGDNPPLSVTRSNGNVILTWPKTNESWLLVETDGLDHCYVSNGVFYCEAYRRRIISGDRYGTNGNTIFIVLPVDFSITNRFYTLQTNNFPAPP